MFASGAGWQRHQHFSENLSSGPGGHTQGKQAVCDGSLSFGLSDICLLLRLITTTTTSTIPTCYFFDLCYFYRYMMARTTLHMSWELLQARLCWGLPSSPHPIICGWSFSVMEKAQAKDLSWSIQVSAQY